ncbi:glycine betaine/L-proline ABC transporter substrate-binding protein ProX [Haloactinopolyspora alba]|uniref:glycine betaine/L-proline ABC transporter substrate-binding protein ProX n=1 Tax=Haloactinopolyspora alba TaxID=648780 RepID=UPI0013ED21F8|nr:glycine betaine/L-proline ABC transporter substrate-binding protein ProX [Haloactinopolyspora alba]
MTALRRLLVLLTVAATATVAAATPGAAGTGTGDDRDDGAGGGDGGDPGSGAESIRMARATWDTGWFQAEVYRQLLEELGYSVESVTTMGNAEFYGAAAAGDVDLWANGWFPLHNTAIEEVGAKGAVEPVGTQVSDGARQGYLIDRASAERHDITSLADLADPAVAEHFDTDDDGKADLLGCQVGWGCESVIERHLDELGLRETVTHVQGNYAPRMDDVVERYQRSEPVLFYTWTPNWTVGELVPGEDVTWLDVPDGWPPNDIRAVGNSAFLDEHPPVRRLLRAVTIPLEDISAQNARMRAGEGAPADIRRHAREWIAQNRGQVDEWLATADPGRAQDGGPAGSGQNGGPAGSGQDDPAPTQDDGTLTVATRALAPFVVYSDGSYTGFSVELWRLIAENLGADYEIQQVNSLAKQIDDVERGAADVALGGLDITADRARSLALSQPTLDSGLQVMVASEEGSGIGSTLSRIASSRIVTWILWFAVIFGLILLVVGHIIWLLERRRNPDIPTDYLHGIPESIWWAVVAITPFGAGNNTPRRNLARVFAVGWILAGYFLLAYFTASITSTMAVDEIRGEITGPDDLAGHSVGSVAQTHGAQYLTARGLGPVLFDSPDEAYAALRAGSVDALVHDAPVLQYQAAHSGEGDLQVVGAVFEEFGYGVGSAYGSGLRQRIDVALLELVESGEYDTLYERWFGTSSP